MERILKSMKERDRRVDRSMKNMTGKIKSGLYIWHCRRIYCNKFFFPISWTYKREQDLNKIVHGK